MLVWMPLGAIGEELGWRGFLHKRLDGALPPWASCLIVAGLWAPWHVGLYANGPVYMALFAVVVLSFTVVLYGLVADLGFNVLVASLFHWAVNGANALSLDLINDTRFMIANSLSWAAVAIIVVVVRRPMFFRAATT